MTSTLERAKQWGAAHRGELVRRWSSRLNLPVERVGEYLCQVIHYDLGEGERSAIDLFQQKCLRHGLIDQPVPVEYIGG